MPRHRAGRLVLPRQETLPRVVVEAQDPGYVGGRSGVRMGVQGRQRKRERAQVVDNLIAVQHGVVEIAVGFRLVDPDESVLVRIEELHGLVFVQPVVGDRIGVRQTQGKVFRKYVTQFPGHCGQEVGLAAGGTHRESRRRRAASRT